MPLMKRGSYFKKICSLGKPLLVRYLNLSLLRSIDLTAAQDIWKRLETLYEGDEFSKQAKMEYWKTKMEGLKMREDESIRAYSQRVNEVVASIKNCGGTYTYKEVIAKIIRSITPAFKVKPQMIQETILIIKDFTKERLITKLSTYEATEFGDVAP